MGKMAKPDAPINVMPCTLEELAAYGGWDRLNLPEGLDRGPRPDTPTAGSAK